MLTDFQNSSTIAVSGKLQEDPMSYVTAPEMRQYNKFQPVSKLSWVVGDTAAATDLNEIAWPNSVLYSLKCCFHLSGEHSISISKPSL